MLVIGFLARGGASSSAEAIEMRSKMNPREPFSGLFTTGGTSLVSYSGASFQEAEGALGEGRRCVVE